MRKTLEEGGEKKEISDERKYKSPPSFTFFASRLLPSRNQRSKNRTNALWKALCRVLHGPGVLSKQSRLQSPQENQQEARRGRRGRCVEGTLCFFFDEILFVFSSALAKRRIPPSLFFVPFPLTLKPTFVSKSFLSTALAEFDALLRSELQKVDEFFSDRETELEVIRLRFRSSTSFFPFSHDTFFFYPLYASTKP